MKVVISSGHGKYVAGASGYIEERPEAVRVVDKVTDLLNNMGIDVTKFHDNVSETQDENLDRIVDFHNSQGNHDLDVSVHFNANEATQRPVGCEVLYVSNAGEKWADKFVDRICDAVPLINRGPKERTGLYFLNQTNEVAVLIETCFVDSAADVEIYNEQFNDICEAIAKTIADEAGITPVPEPPPQGLFYAKGGCSHFGGPQDTGVSADEGLAFIYSYSEAPHLFLPSQPSGTAGLARRLNPDIFYVACRWDYSVTSKGALKRPSYQALVRANGNEFLAWPADWGPHQDTGRVADLSPGLMDALGLETDDEVEVIYPAP